MYLSKVGQSQKKVTFGDTVKSNLAETLFKSKVVDTVKSHVTFKSNLADTAKSNATDTFKSSIM